MCGKIPRPTKKSATVIIVDEIEYCSSGKHAKDNADSAEQTAPSYQAASQPAAQPAAQQSDNFTGYEPFGGANSFLMSKLQAKVPTHK